MIAIELFRNETEFFTYPAGTRIFQEGDTDEAAYMFVVLEGEVDLLVHGKVVETLGPGGVLGEMSLIDTAPRSATALARTECRLVPITRKRFTFLIQQTPNFALQIMRVMAERLRRMDSRL